ncbi:MAG: TasA family protein [Candidatus Paceibacterota bacterium]|jgi:hypothetical protein
MYNLILQKNKIFIALALILSLITFNLNIGATNAYFSDTDSLTDNSLSAGILDIGLDSMSNFTSGLMYPTDTTSTSIHISNTGSLDSQYTVQTTLSGSSTSACDYITMTATSPTDTYTGPIQGFTSVATATVDTAWNFNFTIASDAPPSVWGKTCFFKWTFTTWQDNLPDASSGFSSTKEKLGSIRIGKAVVLNEFISNPSGLDDALMPGGEWVELYNNSSVAFDLSGWAIYDNDDSHKLYIQNSNTNTGGTVIGAHGFLVVYRNGDPDFNLNNDADSVRLATGYPIASSIVVDSYSYTEEKPEGYSYARIPDGVGSWVDPIPTPGVSNELVEEIIEEEPIVELTLTEPIIAEETVASEVVEDETVTEENTKEETVIEEAITEEEQPEEVLASGTETEQEEATNETTETIAPEETPPASDTEVVEEVVTEESTTPETSQEEPVIEETIVPEIESVPVAEEAVVSEEPRPEVGQPSVEAPVEAPASEPVISE